MKTRFEKFSGFTLIEVLTVIVFIAIIAVISFESLSSMRKLTQAHNACNTLAAVMNRARNYALSGKVVGSEVPSAFSVSVSGSVVKILGDDRTTVESVNLPSGSTCEDPSAAEGSKPPGKYQVPNGNGMSARTLTCTYNGATRDVIVNEYKAICQ